MTERVGVEDDFVAHNGEDESYAEMLNALGDGVCVLRTDGTIELGTRSFHELVGREHGTLVGSHVDEVVAEARNVLEVVAARCETDSPRKRAETTVLTGGSDDEKRVEAVWTVSVLDPANGRTLCQVQRRGGERGDDRVLDRVTDAVFAVDDEWQFTYVNERAEALLKRSERDLLGESVWQEFGEAVGTTFQAEYERAMETQKPVAFEAYYPPLDIWFDVKTYPSETGLSVYFRDVSDRVTTTRELERRREQTATVAAVGQRALELEDLGVFIQELCTTVTDVLDADYCKVLDFDEEDEQLLLRRGVGWRDGIVGLATVDADERSQAGYTLITEKPVIVENVETETRFSGPDLLTSHDVKSGISVVIGSTEAPWGILGVHDTDERSFTDSDADFLQSVSNVLGSAIERFSVESKLRDERRLVERIVETSPVGIVVVDETGTIRRANKRAGEIFGMATAELEGRRYDDPDWEEIDTDGEALPVEETTFRRVVESGSVVFDRESGVRRDDGERVWVSVNAVPLGDEAERVVFAISDITERRERERELKRQRERLIALNDLNGTVREITDAVLEQSTRGEIETIVCRRIAEADSYRFAWIGEVDAEAKAVEPRAIHGAERYLDEVSISIDADEERGQGPTGRAVRERTVQTAQDVRTDPRYEPWREIAEEYGFSSSAAIPIVHEGTLYGVLNVYSERRHAFRAEEQAVVGQLGEVIGHAIAAVERKRALSSEEVIEVVFTGPNPFDRLLDGRMEGRVAFERAIPIGEGRYVEYGTITADAQPTLEAVSETLEYCERLSVLEESFDERRFEMLLSEPPIISDVASRGGSVESAVFTEGRARLVVHLPLGVDVRESIDAVTNDYPEVTPVSRRQVSRVDNPDRSLATAWATALTDRQRASLEAAYFAGFFEWPRMKSGEEVADSLDISASTFHHHLRVAERKLFERLFEGVDM